MIKPPGKPGIAIYFSTKTTKKDTYEKDSALRTADAEVRRADGAHGALRVVGVHSRGKAASIRRLQKLKGPTTSKQHNLVNHPRG